MAVQTKSEIEDLISKAKEAQKQFQESSQEYVDKLVRTIGKVVYDRAEELAKMAVDESGMGVYEDKVRKNKGKSKNIWNHLKDKKSVGIVDRIPDKGLVCIAKPVGTIGAITPCTNPIVTPMCNTMFALKGCNSIIVAPHPRVKRCNSYLISLFRDAIAELGAPPDLIQTIEEPSIESSNNLMDEVDLIVATGGEAMVKAAYSHGHPAYGVGAGNVQCILDRNIDLKEAINKIVAGAAFDNGIICSSEQSIIVPEEQYSELAVLLKQNEQVLFAGSESNVEAFRRVLFEEDGTLKKEPVGQSAQHIAKLAGLNIPDSIKVIALKAKGFGNKDVLAKEKLSPVLAVFTYKTFEEAVQIAQTNLEYQGKGHSAVVHSNNQENIEYAGLNLTVSRLVVNQSSSLSAGGALNNGFTPTTTLGCGTWGNNSISENLDYKHLINVSRIGMVIENAENPSDSVIWN